METKAGRIVSPLANARPFRPVKDGRVRTAPLCAIPDLLATFGVEPTDVLASVGLDPALLDDPDAHIPFRTAGRALDACVLRTGCHHFGLLLGQQGGIKTLGLVGLLLRQSTDVGSALRNAASYFHLHDRGGVAYIVIQEGIASIVYDIAEPGVDGSDQIADIAMAVGCNIMRSLCGAKWNAAEVLFARRRPLDVRPYRRFFRAPVLFDAAHNALRFPATWLQQALPGSDSTLRQILAEEVEWLDARYGKDFVAKVRRTVHTLLVTGPCTAARVAGVLSMHHRTLNRRLHEDGASFAALLADVRYDAARRLIEDTDMPIRQIAEVLGYAEISALTRAFRRWSGVSPTRWRAKAHGRSTRRGS